MLTNRVGVLARHVLALRSLSLPSHTLETRTCAWKTSRQLGVLGVSTVLGIGSGYASACEEHRADVQKSSARTVQLTVKTTSALGSSNKSSDVPNLVLVHGLDSWRGTWRASADELARRGISSIAVDQRGHGESPLGPPNDFGPVQLAADLRAAIRNAGLLDGGARIALVGHSMGGLISMRYAADYPEDLSLLVIEDIDCVPWGEPPPSAEQLKRVQTFDRRYLSWESCVADLKTYGYGEKRIRAWREENPPRVFDRPEGGVWSAINPHAQHLATDTVGNSNNGLESLSRLAAAQACGKVDFPIHLFVAGHGGCDWDALPGGVHDMSSVLPSMKVTKFPDAFHSIHNARSMLDFVDTLEKILRELPQRCTD